MTSALIGHTGFVGSTLLRQTSFDDCYNSSNIGAIRGRHYDLLVCAGAPAQKWQANREPAADLANLQDLIGHLQHVTAGRVVLISTVDVYPSPVGVDEDTPIEAARLQPYGKHRRALECFVAGHFPGAQVVRLPGLFGEGLKKNFIYDLLTGNCPGWTHRDSTFQFYDMSCLWSDVQVVGQHGLSLVNVATEPVRAQTIARECFDTDYDAVSEQPPARYDMRSKHASCFGARGPYLRSAAETLERIRAFVSGYLSEVRP